MALKLPDVSQERQPTVQATGGIASYRADQPGGEIAGRQTAQLGADISQSGDAVYQAQDHLDRLQAEDALNALRAKQLEYAYDPTNGFMQKKGADALGGDFRRQYTDKFNSAAEEIQSGLKNDKQRVYFQSRVPIAGIEYQGLLLRHQADQAVKYSTDVTQGTIDTEIQAISADPTNENGFATSLTRIKGVLDDYAHQNGIPAGTLNKLRQEALDRAVAARVQSQASTDPVGALKTFEAIETSVSPDKRLQLQNGLRQMALPISAKEDAQSILKNAPSSAIDVRAQLGSWVGRAEALADKRHPGDAVYKDMVVQQVKGYASTIVAAQEGIARQAAATLMLAAIGQKGGPKPTTTDELLSAPGARQAWGLMEPTAQRGLLALLDHNAKELNGQMTHSDPRLLNQLFDRVMAPDGDAQKITTAKQLVPYFSNGLAKDGYDWLVKQIDRSQSPEGNAFLKQVNEVKSTAKSMLTSSMVGRIQPDLAEEAAYRFGRDVEARLDDYRQKGLDTRALFTPGTKDYLLDPQRVASYMPTARQAVAGEASSSSYKVGETYHFKQGDYQYLGGDAKNAKSWGAIKPATPPGAIEVAQQGQAPASASASAKATVPVLEDAGGGQRLNPQEERVLRAQRSKAELARAGKAVASAASTAAGALVEAVTPPTAPERAVSVFRTLVEQGRYRSWNQEQIQIALDSGFLTKDEETTARAMLKAIGKAKGK